MKRLRLTLLLAATLAAALCCFAEEKQQPLPKDLPPYGPAAPFRAVSLATGDSVGLDHYAGDVVLLNIWATWCAPCLGELPSLNRLQTHLKDEPFVVIALNEDRKAGLETIESVYRDIRIEALPLYLDPDGKVARALQVTGLPTTVLFDRDGRELGRLVGPAEWDGPDALALIRHYLAPSR